MKRVKDLGSKSIRFIDMHVLEYKVNKIHFSGFD